MALRDYKASFIFTLGFKKNIASIFFKPQKNIDKIRAYIAMGVVVEKSLCYIPTRKADENTDVFWVFLDLKTT